VDALLLVEGSRGWVENFVFWVVKKALRTVKTNSAVSVLK
jgi:hypothetical protein